MLNIKTPEETNWIDVGKVKEKRMVQETGQGDVMRDYIYNQIEILKDLEEPEFLPDMIVLQYAS